LTRTILPFSKAQFMDVSQLYREPQPKLCQGDIVHDVPNLYLKPPLQILRAADTRRGRIYTPFTYDTYLTEGEQPEGNRPPGNYKLSNGEQVAVSCQLGLGMILSHGCEIDNDPKNRLIALIRPITAAHAADWDNIRGNKNSAFFHLAAYGDMPESYVDLRRITCVAPYYLDHMKRIASLTETAVAAFQMQFFLYLTRREPTGNLDTIAPIRPDNSP